MLHTLFFVTPLYDNSIATWAAAIVVAVLVTAGVRATRRAVAERLRHIAPQTETLLDDLLLDILERTHFVFELTLGVLLGNTLLTLPGALAAWLHTGLMMAVVLQIGLWANGAVYYGVVLLIDRRSGPEDLAQQSGRNLIRAIGVGLVWAIALLFALDNFGIDVSTLVTGLGVTGLAVGLAGQQIGSDLFASAAILLDRSVLVGDFLIVDNLYLGKVERIGILKTHLRSLEGEKIILANSDLAKSRVRNFRTLEERRVLLAFSIESNTRATEIERLVADVRTFVAAQPRIRFERAHWAGFGEHGLRFEVVYFVQSNSYNDYMEAQQFINLAILRMLERRDARLAVGLALRPQVPVTRLAPSL